MFVWLIFLLLILLLVGSVPNWPYSRGWGYVPVVIIFVVLILFMCVWMFGWMPMWMHQGWGRGMMRR